ncbi:MAG TPA: 2Fe-2S iron-sulfur cluster binding domain-containing protein [Alicycliphilus sp.]|nr:2Fe-2S iron-sulfur cluster binding domain-containing protein [Alicycliphilus sp.]
MDQYEISILETGETILCSPGQSILDGIVKLGSKGIPTGCRGGGCGVCKVEIVKGTYARKPMSRAHVTAQEELHGKGLACRAFPTSNISLRVLGAMSRAVARARMAA